MKKLLRYIAKACFWLGFFHLGLSFFGLENSEKLIFFAAWCTFWALLIDDLIPTMDRS